VDHARLRIEGGRVRSAVW